MTGINSSLPIIINNDSVNLLKLEKLEKFPKGLIISNPEPILLIEATTEEKVVIKS